MSLYKVLEAFTFDALSNEKVDMAYAFPFASTVPAVNNADDAILPLGKASSEYFKYYLNPKMIEMRALIDDRLFKIRNSMDINGVKRKLALFAPPLDPGSLVAAMARSGASLPSLLISMDSPMPNCRVQYLLPTALWLCHELKALSFRYVKIKETADAGELARLRASQYTAVQKVLVDMQSNEVEITKKKLKVVEDDKNAAYMRLNYFQQLLGVAESDALQDSDALQEIPQSIQGPVSNDVYGRTLIDQSEE